MTDGQDMDPTRMFPGFHDHQIDVVFLEDGGEVISIGNDDEGMGLASFGVKRQHMVLNLLRSRARIFNDFVLRVWGETNGTAMVVNLKAIQVHG